MVPRTPNDVIEVLGGVSAVARLTGRSYDAAWNWTKANNFPANTFLVLSKELHKRGVAAPPSLWRQSE